MPLHKGHEYCIKIASLECEKVYVILFYGSIDEEKILKENKEDYLSFKSRKKQLIDICKKYKNTIPTFIDVSKCRLSNGEEDWDGETPLVRKVVGKELNAVYSSEQSYEEYFNRAYKEAIHRIVDYKRIKYPISGTKIRNMNNIKEREKWTI